MVYVAYIVVPDSILLQSQLRSFAFQLNVTNLEGHEFVVGFWGPGVHLHCVLQSNHQELNLVVTH